MEREKTYEIEGHKVIVSPSSTGSVDPWSLDYAIKNNIGLMCTSDMATFALIDGENIYRLKWFGINIDEICHGTWEEFRAKFENYVERAFEQTLSESINDLKELKRRIMFGKLYKFMQFLDGHTERKNTIEMDQELYDFGREIGFVPEDGIIKFNGKTFVIQ